MADVIIILREKSVQQLASGWMDGWIGGGGGVDEKRERERERERNRERARLGLVRVRYGTAEWGDTRALIGWERRSR